MFPRNLSVAGDVAASYALDLLVKRRSHGPESTRSKSTHNRTIFIARGFIKRSQYFETHGIREHDLDAFRASDLHRRGTTRPDFSSHLGATCNALDRRSSAPLKLNRTAWRIRRRTPRSQSDRTAIVAQLSRDCGSSIVESRPRCTPHDSKECRFLFEAKFQRSCFLFEAKLKAIMARSLCLLEPKLERICHGFEAMKPLKESAPTTPSNYSHDRINQPRFFGPIFSLKTDVFLPLFFNF